jgi:hypothetical protein
VSLTQAVAGVTDPDFPVSLTLHDLDDDVVRGLGPRIIHLRNKLFERGLDCRVKPVRPRPGNDGCGIYAALAGGKASTE